MFQSELIARKIRNNYRFNKTTTEHFFFFTILKL